MPVGATSRSFRLGRALCACELKTPKRPPRRKAERASFAPQTQGRGGQRKPVMSSSVASEGPSEPALFTRDFALILATQLAFGFAFSSFFLLPKFVVTELHGSPSQVGYVGALAVVAAVLASPICGKLLDRGARRPLMFWGCLLSGCGGFAFLGVTHVGGYLYVVRAVQGLAYTLYFVAAATLVADLSPAARLGQALGWF